jgi:hypothetical protein
MFTTQKKNTNRKKNVRKHPALLSVVSCCVEQNRSSPQLKAALGYLLVRQTTALSQYPSAEAEQGSHKPRNINGR